MNETKTIVFFDGYCGLCNGLIDFLMKRDQARRLLFSPLQGQLASQRLTESERADLDSVIVLSKRGQKLKHSTAVLETFKELGGAWNIFANLALIFPEPLRNVIYRVIAKNRYRWFGKLDVCRIPTPEERSRFLD